MFWNLPSNAGDVGSIPGWGPKIPRVCVCVCVKLFQLCLTLCDPVDHRPPGSSVCRIFQARILQWLLCPPPGDLPDPGKESLSPMSPLLLAPPGTPQDPTYLRATKPGHH